MNAEEVRARWEFAEQALLDEMGAKGVVEDIDLERTCARAPEYAAEIRALYATWRNLARAMGDGEGLHEAVEAHSTALGGAAGDSKRGAPTAEMSVEGLLGSLRERNKTCERYRTKNELGHGGMGFVVRAWDADLKRNVAMKFLRGVVTPGTDRGELRASARSIGRFLEEAQVTGQLDHPGILPVYDVGIDELGRLFFTMRMVQGETLETVIQRSHAGDPKWSSTGVLGVLLRACEAVAFAHARGVVHRDLKPANVMVGSFGEVYVVDWGLARLVGDTRPETSAFEGEPTQKASVRSDRRERSGSDSSLLTEAGDVLGTPAYMSPEQAGGARETLDARSDVYSMGAILYHLLAGRRPYSDLPPSDSARELTSMVASRGPTPLTTTARGAPDELVSICNKAMAREPAARYATVVDLAEDLRAYLENRVVQAHHTGVALQLAKWITRNRKLVVTAGVATVVLVVSLATFAWHLSNAIHAREQLQRESDRDDDRLRARELIDLARELHPALPETLPAMDSWIARADALLEHTGVHEAFASSIEVRESPHEAAQMKALLDAFEELVVVRRTVLARREDAASITRRSLEEHAAAWRDAREAIALIPAYAEPFGAPLVIEPQLGLVPIGPDPRSGLWEFLVLQSGTAPVREGDRLRIEESSGIVLVLLPGGESQITLHVGWPTNTVVPVHLHPFFMAKHLVTQGQWLRVMGSNPSYCSPTVGRRGKAPTINEDDRFDLRYPVESVGWSDCDRFVRRLGLRLPFDAQWEYGQRAGTTTRFWCGDDPSDLAKRENVRWRDPTAAPDAHDPHDVGDVYAMTSPVDEFDPNPFGLHDTTGNLIQWCRDQRHDAEGGERRSGDGACVGCAPVEVGDAAYMVRGIQHNESPGDSGANTRRTMPEAWRNNVVGFRVSRPLWPCPRCPLGAPAHE